MALHKASPLVDLADRAGGVLDHVFQDSGLSWSFNPIAPTAWLAEGLLIYLPADKAARLLTAVGELSAPGSQLAFEHGDIVNSTLLAQTRGMPTMDQYTSLWKGGLGEDAAGWLSRHGWQPQLHDLAELAASYDRPVPGPWSGRFLTAVRTGR